MNLTSLINKSAKALALSAAFVALPFLAYADDAQKPADHVTYEPQLDNQRDPNQYCAKCHKFNKIDKNQTLDRSGGELHFGKFHGAHLDKKNPNNGKAITCVSCHGNVSENHRRGAKDVMRLKEIFSVIKNRCIQFKNKTKFVLLAINLTNFVKNYGLMMYTQ